MPNTLEGILADVRGVAAELGLELHPISPEEFQEMAHRARKRRGQP
ncbi:MULTISPECIES: hypothetical protein [unclassified Streptomyces]|nr:MULTISPECIES: hypothetical protein [unclassified Streptomyces]MCX5052128.1 hypothetical protein [Streptomyces sp. NBC_00474]